MKLKIIVAFSIIVLGLIIYLSIIRFSSTKFDKAYWHETNRFYMVFDMSVPFDSLGGNDLSYLDMFKISHKRTGMAKSLIHNKTLVKMTKQEVVCMLGNGSTSFIGGGDYQNSLQYVIDAEKRGFQFYGESGILNNYLVIFFNENNIVNSVHITDSKGNF